MKEEKPEQYALVRLDKLRKWPPAGLMAIRATQAIDTLEKMGLLDWCHVVVPGRPEQKDPLLEILSEIKGLKLEREAKDL